MPNHNNKINQCASVLFAGKRLAGKAAALLVFCRGVVFRRRPTPAAPPTTSAPTVTSRPRSTGRSNGDTIQLAAGHLQHHDHHRSGR